MPRKTRGAPPPPTALIKRPAADAITRLELEGKTISIFAPTDELWTKLNAIVAAFKANPPANRPLGWLKVETKLFPLSSHVLSAVFEECTDTPFEGHPEDLIRITAAVLKTWDTAYFLQGYWYGFVLAQARTFAAEFQRKNKEFSLALDRHPRLATKFVEFGDSAAQSLQDPASDISEPIAENLPRLDANQVNQRKLQAPPTPARLTARADKRPRRNKRKTKVKPRILEVTVAIERLNVTIHYDGGTQDTIDVRNEQAARWLKVLAERPGKWISGPELVSYDAELDGQRTDRLKNNLPEKLLSLIETSTRTGSRLNLAQPGAIRRNQSAMRHN